MANPYTASYLVASLKRRGQLASTPQQLDVADYLALATEELQTYVVPFLLSVREEYLVASLDVAGAQGFVPMPPRAIGGRLRQVLLANGQGGYSALDRVEPEREGVWPSGGGSTPCGYVLDGNGFRLLPPNASGTLRLKYFLRPNRLVAETAVGLITGINTGTGALTVAASTSFTGAVSCDLVQGQPPFSTQAMDAVGSVSGNTVTFTPPLPATLAAGDYVCLSGESPIPQVPVELHPLLAQRVTAKALEALGDMQGAQAADGQCERAKKTALSLLANRVEGQPRFIINRFAPGWRRRWF